MRRFALLVLLLLGSQSGALIRETAAQDLVTRFRHARIREVASTMAHRFGLRLEPRPTDPLGVKSDSIRAWLASMEPKPPAPPPPPEPDPLQIDSVRVVRSMERPVFRSRFGSRPFAFLQGQSITTIDTLQTRILRGVLQRAFGDPTWALADIDSIAGRPDGDIIQFEYWLVLNDSIPFMVLDAHGFLDRGIVVATDASLRDRLDELRRTILEPLIQDATAAPYVDYYYLRQTGQWYATGFDGASYFDRRIERPDLKLGRPRIETYLPTDPNR